MAYLSSTTTAPNPPQCVTQSIAGPRSWVYKSTHVASDVEGAYFFTDGAALGMKIGDPVLVVQVDSLTSTGAFVYAAGHAVIAEGTTTIQLSSGALYSS